jgi:hypothetical protein
MTRRGKASRRGRRPGGSLDRGHASHVRARHPRVHRSRPEQPMKGAPVQSRHAPVGSRSVTCR